MRLLKTSRKSRTVNLLMSSLLAAGGWACFDTAGSEFVELGTLDDPLPSDGRALFTLDFRDCFAAAVAFEPIGREAFEVATSP